MYRIVTCDKAYSSWSLRGWLLLEAFGLPFEDVPVRIYDPDFDDHKAARAPVRTVPVLEWEEGGRSLRVWESLAIAETLAERHPDAGIWPDAPAHRAVARSLAAEMHGGFQALRTACPMNLHRAPRALTAPPEGLAADVARVGALWDWALRETGGPWLGGPRFSAVDAFYVPVAFRLRGYALGVPGGGDYADRLVAHPAVARWVEMALADPRRLAVYDVD